MTKSIVFYSQLDEVRHFCCTRGKCLTMRSWTLFSTPLRDISTCIGKTKITNYELRMNEISIRKVPQFLIHFARRVYPPQGGTKKSTPLRGASCSVTFLCILTTAFILLCPSLTWALQHHDAPEGLYVHQMAHILFMASLVYLVWDIRRNAFSGRGWRYLLLFCLFMFFWNLLALVGHDIAVHLSKSDFFTDSTYLYTRISGPFSFAKLTFYIAKLDHLISVPALFFLFMALRTFYRSIETDDFKGEDE